MDPRYRIDDIDALPSPSLVLFGEVLRANLDAMIGLAGGTDRLRPHAKTHKMPAIIRLLEARGIGKHKCATLAEAEMIARAGGRDVLIAYPMVGPNVARLAALMRAYPAVTFRTAVDDLDATRALSAGLDGAGRPLPCLVDLDVGMGRTGIEPGPAAVRLYRELAALPNLVPDGLQAYDGHRREAAPGDREAGARAGAARVVALRRELEAEGLPVPRLVLGGTPSFPAHAGRDEPGLECSPGTSLLHDEGYGSKFPDLPFTPAALVVTRVISRPGTDRLCLDLGHKAVAGDPTGPRFRLLGPEDAVLGPQSEEHQVVETKRARDYPVGHAFLAIPVHVCPTMALHADAAIIEGGRVVGRWEVAARDRALRL